MEYLTQAVELIGPYLPLILFWGLAAAIANSVIYVWMCAALPIDKLSQYYKAPHFSEFEANLHSRGSGFPANKFEVYLAFVVVFKVFANKRQLHGFRSGLSTSYKVACHLFVATALMMFAAIALLVFSAAVISA